MISMPTAYLGLWELTLRKIAFKDFTARNLILMKV